MRSVPELNFGAPGQCPSGGTSEGVDASTQTGNASAGDSQESLFFMEADNSDISESGWQGARMHGRMAGTTAEIWRAGCQHSRKRQRLFYRRGGSNGFSLWVSHTRGRQKNDMPYPPGQKYAILNGSIGSGRVRKKSLQWCRQCRRTESRTFPSQGSAATSV